MGLSRTGGAKRPHCCRAIEDFLAGGTKRPNSYRPIEDFPAGGAKRPNDYEAIEVFKAWGCQTPEFYPTVLTWRLILGTGGWDGKRIRPPSTGSIRASG